MTEEIGSMDVSKRREGGMLRQVLEQLGAAEPRNESREAMFRVSKRLEIEIWPARMKAVVNGVAIELTRHEMILLALLADRAGRVLKRVTLIRELHGMQSDVSDRAADLIVHRLRKKLGPAGAIIETVRSSGYRLSGEVQQTRMGFSALPALLAMGWWRWRCWGERVWADVQAGLLWSGWALPSMLLLACMMGTLGWVAVRPDGFVGQDRLRAEVEAFGTVDIAASASAMGFRGGSALARTDKRGVFVVAEDASYDGTPGRLREMRLDITQGGELHAEVRHVWASPKANRSAASKATADSREASFDIEAMAWVDGRLWIADERFDFVKAIDADGNLQQALRLPDSFHRAGADRRDQRHEMGIEHSRGVAGLAFSPSGSTVWVAPQGPLSQDGVDLPWVRFAQIDLSTGKSREYLFELSLSSNVIGDIAWWDTDRLLVIEHDTSLSSGYRHETLYVVDISDADNVEGLGPLADGLDAPPRPMKKRQLLRLGDIGSREQARRESRFQGIVELSPGGARGARRFMLIDDIPDAHLGQNARSTIAIVQIEQP